MVWGNPIELSTKDQKNVRFKNRLLRNRVILSAYDLSDANCEQYLRFLNRYQPEYLYGYATALDTLARILEPVCGRLRCRPAAVISTSETLYPEQRARLKSIFRCQVANEYGARDAGILAFECPCGGLHITAENVLLEIVDPITLQPVPDGCRGLVVTTDLTNHAMPRLRYLLGDVAARLPAARCPCGRSLPLLQPVEGREDAIFCLPGGRLVHGNFLNQLARKYDAILQFRLTQSAPEIGTLQLVLDHGRSGWQTEAAAFARDAASFLPGMQLETRQVSEIPVTASGKHRYAVRTFPL